MGSGKRYRIATVAGIPFYVGSSWLFIAALYVYIQYVRLTGSSANPTDVEAIGLAILGAVLFFGGVVIHEGAHAVMARALNIPVAAITLVFWGGATEAKANTRGPLGEFLVAFVGPASTLVLAGVFWVAGEALGGLIGVIVRDLARLNLFFAAINAVPGFPLDGGRILLATAWGVTRSRRAALRVTGWVGLVIGSGAAVLAVTAFLRDNGWWLILGYMAFLMISTGRTMETRIKLRDQLGQGTVADVMRPPPPEVPASMPLSDALDRYLREADGHMLPVVDGGKVVGAVSLRSARRAGGRDPFRPVREGMASLAEVPVVAPDEPLDDALEWVAGRQGLVLRDGVLVGAISADDVERWYRRRFEGRSPAQPREVEVGADGLLYRPGDEADGPDGDRGSDRAGDDGVPIPPRPDR